MFFGLQRKARGEKKGLTGQKTFPGKVRLCVRLLEKGGGRAISDGRKAHVNCGEAGLGEEARELGRWRQLRLASFDQSLQWQVAP